MKSTQRTTSTVHLTGSASHLEEDMRFLRRIIDTVHSHEFVIARNWVEPAYLRSKRNPKEVDINWDVVFQDNLEAIARSDMVIIEGTHYGFGQGYQAAVALQQKKPVLLVSRDSSIEQRLVAGLSDELFTIKLYEDEDELEKIVSKFLQNNTLTNRDMRFNFFLDRQIYNHLRWVSFKTGKTKAEIIRDLIDKEIDRSEH